MKKEMMNTYEVPVTEVIKMETSCVIALSNDDPIGGEEPDD